MKFNDLFNRREHPDTLFNESQELLIITFIQIHTLPGMSEKKFSFYELCNNKELFASKSATNMSIFNIKILMNASCK